MVTEVQWWHGGPIDGDHGLLERWPFQNVCQCRPSEDMGVMAPSWRSDVDIPEPVSMVYQGKENAVPA